MQDGWAADGTVPNGIGAQIDSKHGAEQFDAIDDPLAAVFEVIACERTGATQKGPADTPRDAMVIRCLGFSLFFAIVQFSG